MKEVEVGITDHTSAVIEVGVGGSDVGAGVTDQTSNVTEV